MDESKIPQHVGIIMDGNGRWAKARGKKRTYGHKHGSQNVDRIVTHAFNSGVKSLTLYAFSCENWQRPREEVEELMKLLKIYFTKYIKKVVKNNVKLVVVGDMNGLSADLRQVVLDAMKSSSGNDGHILNIAINYGGRQEIIHAVKECINNAQELTVENILSNLYTAESGEPDLIIRTGGEIRTSNFLMFQGAYSELYFTEVFWPDFDEKEFDKALASFSERQRRFGKA